MVGPTSIQLVDNGLSFGDNEESDLNQLVCAFFVDSILAAMPRSKRQKAKKGEIAFFFIIK